MKLSEEQMAYLEQMTMLRVPEEQRPKMMEDIGKIVEYIETLKFADNVEEMEDLVTTEEQLRNDEVKAQYTREEMIANAPEEQDGTFVVPKTI
mgnify:CR=1 FL=1